ncbi:hypothetical protein Tco_1458724 [Tanacetum coccineum]
MLMMLDSTRLRVLLAVINLAMERKRSVTHRIMDMLLMTIWANGILFDDTLGGLWVMIAFGLGGGKGEVFVIYRSKTHGCGAIEIGLDSRFWHDQKDEDSDSEDAECEEVIRRISVVV